MLHIHKVDGNVFKMSNIKLKDFLERADRPYMMQCKRNTIVNKHHVEDIDIVNGMIVFKNGECAEIGIRYKQSIKEAFS